MYEGTFLLLVCASIFDRTDGTFMRSLRKVYKISVCSGYRVRPSVCFITEIIWPISMKSGIGSTGPFRPAITAAAFTGIIL
jgi:hypothetical protein